jgi:hypothetical protein
MPLLLDSVRGTGKNVKYSLGRFPIVVYLICPTCNRVGKICLERTS